jgi:hypothetical protein
MLYAVVLYENRDRHLLVFFLSMPVLRSTYAISIRERYSTGTVPVLVGGHITVTVNVLTS